MSDIMVHGYASPDDIAQSLGSMSSFELFYAEDSPYGPRVSVAAPLYACHRWDRKSVMVDPHHTPEVVISRHGN
jgi:hypothetical protein